MGGLIGARLPRLEDGALLTGNGRFIDDIARPGVLHAAFVRSPHPHAAIRRIDTHDALAMPGVHAVLTLDDLAKVMVQRRMIRHSNSGMPLDKAWPFALANGEVCYVGEPVAVVIAADPHIAEEAVQLIVADYEELPAVYDEIEAADNKTLVHEELRPAGTFADLKHLTGRRGTNIAIDYKLRRGDVDKAFAGAAHVFEHTFRTQKCLHVALEPHASIADWKEWGLTIHSSSQGPSFVRTEIARLIGWPENRSQASIGLCARTVRSTRRRSTNSWPSAGSNAEN